MSIERTCPTCGLCPVEIDPRTDRIAAHSIGGKPCEPPFSCEGCNKPTRAAPPLRCIDCEINPKMQVR